ncbi:MAG: BMP family lipoprotein [Acidimicrobiales bacterium]
MKHRSLRRIVGLFAAVGLLLAACGEADDDDDATDTTAEGGAGGAADFQACQVTDTGGVDDRSFNQTAFAGVTQAEDELGIEASVLESQSDADFDPNIQTFIDQGCDIIVTVGFLLGDATAAAAEANPDQQFAIVDFDFFDLDAGEDVTFDNVRELTFSTDQAAFLAGYLAAGMTQTGRIGTYGGINIPTVNIFMKGFEAGMSYYNDQKGTAVQLVGWSTAADDGLFTGDFEDQTKGRATTEQLLDEGADIILPVAGPVGLGSVEAIRARGNTARLIWVDTDGCVSVEQACDLFLTSVMKNMNVAVFDTVSAAVGGEFEGGLYVGTLENQGVDIAPFNEFEGQVPAELTSEIDLLREEIIAGNIETILGG